jgi:hypothetical protein
VTGGYLIRKIAQGIFARPGTFPEKSPKVRFGAGAPASPKAILLQTGPYPKNRPFFFLNTRKTFPHREGIFLTLMDAEAQRYNPPDFSGTVEREEIG